MTMVLGKKGCFHWNGRNCIFCSHQIFSSAGCLLQVPPLSRLPSAFVLPVEEKGTVHRGTGLLSAAPHPTEDNKHHNKEESPSAPGRVLLAPVSWSV